MDFCIIPFLAQDGLFLAQRPKFWPKNSKTQCQKLVGSKKRHLRAKNSPMRKLEKMVTADPPKPHIGPPDPPDGLGRRKMAKIVIIQFSNDIFFNKKPILEGVSFFGFFTNTDPNVENFTMERKQGTGRKPQTCGFLCMGLSDSDSDFFRKSNSFQ